MDEKPKYGVWAVSFQIPTFPRGTATIRARLFTESYYQYNIILLRRFFEKTENHIPNPPLLGLETHMSRKLHLFMFFSRGGMGILQNPMQSLVMFLFHIVPTTIRLFQKHKTIPFNFSVQWSLCSDNSSCKTRFFYVFPE